MDMLQRIERVFEESSKQTRRRMSNRLSLLGGIRPSTVNCRVSERKVVHVNDDNRKTTQEQADRSWRPLDERSRGQDIVVHTPAQPERLPAKQEPPPVVVQDIND